MEFLPTVSAEATNSELEVWQTLKEALRGEEGIAFLHYPVFPADRRYRYEPDILLLHRHWGLFIIEVKGCRPEQVLALEGANWQMVDWYEPAIAPQKQTENQLFALLDHFHRYAPLARARGAALVALPRVTEADWKAKGFSDLPCNPRILHADHLTPSRLRRRLQEFASGGLEAEEAWNTACQVVGLRSALERARSPHDAPGHPLLAAVRESEKAVNALDNDQLRIGLEIPPGPQRIRGIAGSGKTLLLAIKAARMHLSHPEWDIAFTFNTRSLYGTVREQIERFCLHFGQAEPDWSKLRVLHGWGGRQEEGLYHLLATEAAHPVRSVEWAKRQKEGSIAEHLALVCQELLDSGLVQPRFDAVLIDEGQDFLPEFYRLAHAALREPKRLIWAYDEAQSLDHLKIPNAETLFGRDEEGNLLVDLVGQYLGGIHKSRIMRKCYRTPAAVLVAAHAFGMGLLRPEGAVQLITSRQGWQDIGYNVVSGAFDQAGQEVVLERPLENCPHPLEQDGEWPLLRHHTYPTREDELTDTAGRIAELVGLGVMPDEVLVIFLGPSWQVESGPMAALAHMLRERGVPSHRADKTNASLFRKPGCVTLSGIHRAKGNEAPYVFVLGLDQVAKHEGDVASRNQLFVALSRTRAVCRLTGLYPEAESLMEEFELIVRQGRRLKFRTPEAGKVKRPLGELPEVVPIRPFVTHLPLYDLVAAAGAWRSPQAPDPEPLDWVEASEFGRLNEKQFVVRIAGDSMAPRIEDGSLAIFQKADDEWPVNKIVIASLPSDEGDSLLVKRLLLKEEAGLSHYVLQSINPAFQPIPVQGPEAERVRIVGVFKRTLT